MLVGKAILLEVLMNITLGGRSELGNQKKDIRCAEEQFFKQLIQLRPKRVNCTKRSEHMSLKAGIGTFRRNQCNEESIDK